MGGVGHGHKGARGIDSFGEEVEGAQGRRLPHCTAAEMAGVGQGATAEVRPFLGPSFLGMLSQDLCA